jgi:hypothetical protein
MHNEKDDSKLSCVFFKPSGHRRNAATSSEDRQNSSSDDETQPTASTFRSSRVVRKGLVTTSKDNSSNKSDRQTKSLDPKDMGATATVQIDTDNANSNLVRNKGRMN